MKNIKMLKSIAEMQQCLKIIKIFAVSGAPLPILEDFRKLFGQLGKELNEQLDADINIEALKGEKTK